MASRQILRGVPPIFDPYKGTRPVIPVRKIGLFLKAGVDTSSDDLGHGDAFAMSKQSEVACLFLGELDLCSDHINSVITSWWRVKVAHR